MVSVIRSKTPASRAVPQDTAYATLQGLLRWRLLAKGLSLSKQRKLLASQAGLHTSRFRGRGIDFAEVRAYHPGDDIRTIDWRVTARTGKAHTKLYSEERERPVIIMVDQRQTMFFGSRTMFKSTMAAHCAALLAWATLQRGDRLGGIAFSDTRQSEIRARRSPHTVLHLLESIIEFNRALSRSRVPQSSLSMAAMLQSLRQTTKPGSELFIISDFHDFDADCEHQLFQLARHNDPVCVAISDPLEEHLPPPGHYGITNGRERGALDLLDSGIRARWEAQHHESENRFTTQLAQLKVPLIRLSTDADLLQTLQRGLGISQRNGNSRRNNISPSNNNGNTHR